MTSPWKPMAALPDFMECPDFILVWNECNGVSEIRVEPDDIYKLREDKGWRLWRDVPRPSEADIARAKKRTRREVMNERPHAFSDWRAVNDPQNELSMEEAAWQFAPQAPK